MAVLFKEGSKLEGDNRLLQSLPKAWGGGSIQGRLEAGAVEEGMQSWGREFLMPEWDNSAAENWREIVKGG